MPTLTIRNLDEETHRGLRLRAAGKGRSMEAEARAILADAVAKRPTEEEIDAALARIRERIRQASGGIMPTGVVDELIADRRRAAARGE